MLDDRIFRKTMAERLGLATATAGLIASAIVGLVTLPQEGGAADKRTPLPPHESGGRVLTRLASAGFLGVVLDAQNRALLHVVVPKGTHARDCNLIQPMVTVTEQDADTVRIVASGFEYLPRSTAQRGLGGTTCVMAGTASVPVKLAQPLGLRHLHNSTSPQSMTVADPLDFPRLHTLPSGYRHRSASPVDDVAGRLVATRIYSAGKSRLTVRIGSRFDVVTEGVLREDTTVRGGYAAVYVGHGQRCIAWTEISGRVREVCSVAAPPLTTARLLPIARSLR